MLNTDDYWEVLDLPKGASEKEIKNAYRKLAKQFHPDRNSDEKSHEYFILINQAYDHLLNYEPPLVEEETYEPYRPPRNPYEARKQQEWGETHYREAARKRNAAKAYARRMAEERKQYREALMRLLLKGFNWVAMCILVYNLLVVADYFLPLGSQPMIVKKATRIDRSGSDYLYDLQLDNRFLRVKYPDKVTRLYRERVVVGSTLLFSIPINVELLTEEGTILMEEHFSAYRFFWVLVPLSLITTWGYFFYFTHPDNRMSCAVVIGFLAFLQWALVNFF